MRIKKSLKTQNTAGLFEVNSKKSECLIKTKLKFNNTKTILRPILYIRTQLGIVKIGEQCKRDYRKKSEIEMKGS